MRQIFALVALVTMTACSPNGSSGSSAGPAGTSASAVAVAPQEKASGMVPLPEVKVDLSSPDRAMKTFFAYQDLNVALSFNYRIDHWARTKEWLKPLAGAAAVFDGVAKSYANSYLHLAPRAPSRPDVYARDIIKVDTETETRAIVLVNIKNVTPLPAGAEVDDIERRWRSEGFNFRYVMTKSSEGWKIEDVQSRELDVKTMKEEWRRIGELQGVDKVDVPSVARPLFN